MPVVYLELQGPGAERPKAPREHGWQSPAYRGLTAAQKDAVIELDGWVGVRTDDLVVVDCDDDEAIDWWTQAVPAHQTWTRKTPHGQHFIYWNVPGGPSESLIRPIPGINLDILAGHRRQIVFAAPGYADINKPNLIHRIDLRWLPQRARVDHTEEDWSEMPEGRGNVTMAAIAGTLRKQGMNYETILSSLLGINKLTMTESPMSMEEVEQIARSVSRYEPNPDIELVVEGLEDGGDGLSRKYKAWIDDRTMTEPKGVEWLWHPYLPVGKLVLVEGAEGLGKGMLSTWVARNVADAVGFEPGQEMRHGTVLWLSAEDDPQEDIKRRLIAAGRDEYGPSPILFLDNYVFEPTFPRHIEAFTKLVEAEQPRLIILDPLRSFIAPEDKNVEASYNNEAALRPGLRKLMQLAERYRCTIIGVHHWNKRSEGSTRDKSSGSGSFRQIARHVVVLARADDQTALGVVKSNMIDADFTVRSYFIEPVEGTDTAKFEIGGRLGHRTLDEWIAENDKIADEGMKEIVVVLDWVDVLRYYRPELGTLAPTAAQIQKDMQVTAHESRAMLAVLVDKAVISGRPRKWVMIPSDIALAWKQEEGTDESD